MLVLFWPPKTEDHDVTGNRVPELLQGTYSFFTRVWSSPQLSIFSQNTSQYFCWTRLSIFAEHHQYFEDNFSAYLQNTLKYFCRTYLKRFYRTHYRCEIFEIISQYFCLTTLSIFKNFPQKFSRTPLSTFGEYFRRKPSANEPSFLIQSNM